MVFKDRKGSGDLKLYQCANPLKKANYVFLGKSTLCG
jgi:hypothetical protein